MQLSVSVVPTKASEARVSIKLPLIPGNWRAAFDPLPEADGAEAVEIRSPAHGFAAIGAPLRLSIIDLDRTLTRRPTYSRFLLGAARAIAPWRLLLVPAILLLMLGYKMGLTSRKRLKERMHHAMLGPHLARARFDAMVTRFVEREVASNCYAAGFELIAREHREGRIVIIATAAPAYYAAALGRRLGADAIVATPGTWRDERLYPAIHGENCYGLDKLAAVRRVLVEAGSDLAKLHVRVYSDDLSDLPLFEWCDEPFAVNPSARLERLARSRGWRILDWRRAERRGERAGTDDRRSLQTGEALQRVR